MENREQRKGRPKAFKINNPNEAKRLGDKQKSITHSTPKRVEQVKENIIINY
jgi:hypothetical protein